MAWPENSGQASRLIQRTGGEPNDEKTFIEDHPGRGGHNRDGVWIDRIRCRHGDPGLTVVDRSTTAHHVQDCIGLFLVAFLSVYSLIDLT